MAETARQLRLVRFGDFEVDLRSGELRQGWGEAEVRWAAVSGSDHPAGAAGRSGDAEELQKRLWPETFVDVDHNLNTAINKIREILGDSAERPRFVETLPRRGYRFIGELEPPVQPVVPVKPDPVISPGIGVRIALVFSPFRPLPSPPSFPYRWLRPQRPPEQAARDCPSVHSSARRSDLSGFLPRWLSNRFRMER